MINLFVGLGEVGTGVSSHFIGRKKEINYFIDTKPDKTSKSIPTSNIDFMHIAIPYGENFEKDVINYARQYNPRIIIIESTVPVGMTRHLSEMGKLIVHSPVRGRHPTLGPHVKKFQKYVGALDKVVGEEVVQHYKRVGIPAVYVGEPETTELGKLFETTYYGICIGWHQEMQRYCDKHKVSFEKAYKIWNEDYNNIYGKKKDTKYLCKATLFPGYIGGHCVMPNLNLLEKSMPSKFIDALRDSNERWPKPEDKKEEKK